jgi:predicted PurR-regulated permease PerM
MSQISTSTIRQVFLMLLIAGIFWVLFQNLNLFIPAVLGAYALYVLLRAPLFHLTDRWKWPKKVAAAVLLLLSFTIILLPFNWVFILLQGRIISLFQNSDNLLQNAEQVVKLVETKYNVSLLTPDNLKTMTDWMVHEAQIIVGATLSGVGMLIATYFILWFMLTDGKKMEQSFFDWLPLRAENVEFVKKHMNDMVWGNALGIPLMGVVQGLAGFLIYWLADIPEPWLWFAITFVAGMMPVVGVSLAYIPLSLILLSQGQEGKALLIFLYGVIVVGSVDNLARMWFLKQVNQTHPLITLFGVISGLKIFGFIGFIFGPILIALFIMLLQVYHKEFTEAPLNE